MDNGVVLNGSWTVLIAQEWERSHDPHDESFLDKIWEMSMTAFDIPREVQVVIDSNDKLYMDFGTPGFVSFSSVPKGMKLPIRCWIHTHPFGAAYFSATDWSTIRTWRTMLDEAIVLGDKQHMIWKKGSDYTVFHQKEKVDLDQTTLNQYGLWVDTQTRIDDWEEE